MLVEDIDVVHLGGRREEVSSDKADLVFHVSLLVSRGGVAKRVGEAVVRCERAEEVGGAHFLANPPSNAGRVVEHDS